MSFDIAFSVVISFVAMIMDLRTARIDNGWILFSVAAVLFYRAVNGEFMEIWLGLPGLLLPLMLLGGLFCFRMIGAGDIKLFCALGFLMGMETVGKCILAAFFLGAAISLTILISCGIFCQRILFLICYLKEYIKTGVRKPYRKNGMEQPENFHFTVPIFMSVLLHAGGVY